MTAIRLLPWSPYQAPHPLNRRTAWWFRNVQGTEHGPYASRQQAQEAARDTRDRES